MDEHTEIEKTLVDELFAVGAHMGYSKSRRHPTQKPYIFGSKNGNEIFDLEKTALQLSAAEEVARAAGRSRGQMLLVGTKFEVKSTVRAQAEAACIPYVSERWLGGTLTNFPEMRKRVGRLEDLTMRKDKNLLTMYTKKERLLLDREIEKLLRFFSGVVTMKAPPALMCIIDPREEKTAVAEAKQLKIPVIALAGSDCNISDIRAVVSANDASRAATTFFITRIITAYTEGVKEAPELVTMPLVMHTEATMASPFVTPVVQTDRDTALRTATSILGTAE